MYNTVTYDQLVYDALLASGALLPNDTTDPIFLAFDDNLITMNNDGAAITIDNNTSTIYL